MLRGKEWGKNMYVSCRKREWHALLQVDVKHQAMLAGAWWEAGGREGTHGT